MKKKIVFFNVLDSFFLLKNEMPLNTIILDNFECKSFQYKSKNFCFELIDLNKNKKIKICCDTEEEMNSWMSSINNLKKKKKKSDTKSKIDSFFEKIEIKEYFRDLINEREDPKEILKEYPENRSFIDPSTLFLLFFFFFFFIYFNFNYFFYKEQKNLSLLNTLKSLLN